MHRPENFRIFSPLTPRGACLKTFFEKFNPVRIMLEPPSRETYIIIFLDIIGSTEYFFSLGESFLLPYQFHSYFGKGLDAALTLRKSPIVCIKEYDFKLLGDGILILIPLKEFNRVLEEANIYGEIIPSREISIKIEGGKRKLIVREQRESITPETLMEKIYKELNNSLKQLNTPFKVRVLGGLGSLFKIPYGKDSYEYLGCPISYLVKKSKEVDTYKWFGEITREKCQELLNS